MNIWALKKDIRIKTLLILLSEQISLSQIVIDVSEQLHSQSVRLMDKEENSLSVYIFTYGQVDNRYGLELEYPDKLKISSFQGEIYENLCWEQLVEIISTHFNLLCETA